MNSSTCADPGLPRRSENRLDPSGPACSHWRFLAFILVATTLAGGAVNQAANRAPDLRNFAYPESDLSDRPAILKNGRFIGDHLTVEVALSLKKRMEQEGRAYGIVVVNVDSGGSGSFRHLCLLTTEGRETVCADTVLLGDRIKITRLSSRENRVLVQSLVRQSSESFAVQPTIKQTMGFTIEKGRLKPVK